MSNPWTYQDFTNSIELCLYQVDEFFYKLTFEAFDMNDDGFLSEVDLFLVLKNIKDNGLLKVLSFDLSNIIEFISSKKKEKGTHDDVQFRFNLLMNKVAKIKREVRLKSILKNDSTEDNETNFFEFLTQALVSNISNPSAVNTANNSPERSVNDSPSTNSRRIHNYGISSRLASATQSNKEKRNRHLNT
jgi:hypothetical protein